jgi:hypothetical protein
VIVVVIMIVVVVVVMIVIVIVVMMLIIGMLSLLSRGTFLLALDSLNLLASMLVGIDLILEHLELIVGALLLGLELLDTSLSSRENVVLNFGQSRPLGLLGALGAQTGLDR